MQIVSRNTENIVLQLSTEEAALLVNALNESLESIEDWEFDIRMGASKEQVEKLLAAFNT